MRILALAIDYQLSIEARPWTCTCAGSAGSATSLVNHRWLLRSIICTPETLSVIRVSTPRLQTYHIGPFVERYKVLQSIASMIQCVRVQGWGTPLSYSELVNLSYSHMLEDSGTNTYHL
jgi:hypothetical protein